MEKVSHEPPKRAPRGVAFKKGFDPRRQPPELRSLDKHYLWQGERPSYTAVHKWIVKHYGKPTQCQDCKATDRWIEWANISKKYLRKRSDFKPLCRRCHYKFDNQ